MGVQLPSPSGSSSGCVAQVFCELSLYMHQSSEHAILLVHTLGPLPFYICIGFFLRIAEQSRTTFFFMSPLYIISLGLLLLHVPHWCSSAAATSDTLTAGQSLAVGSKLISGNSKFALGFFQPAASSISYLAPEWLTGVAITPKIDVYSFGMVLMEIISGRRNLPDNTSSSSSHHVEYFPVQAISKLHGGDVKSLVDPQLHGDFNLEEAERVCKVACWCIQDHEFDRRRWVKWFGFSRVYRRLMCPRCQDYLQL